MARQAPRRRDHFVEWFNYWGEQYPFDKGMAAQLVAELVRSDFVDSDAWSQRTEAEIRSAISADDLLSRNTWNRVRCSRNGCIAAIDPLPAVDNNLIQQLASRFSENIIPRRNPTHADLVISETDGIREKKIAYHHLLFFFFPEALRGSPDTAQPEKATAKYGNHKT